MKTKELMEIALKAGEILLCSGAEIYRVEDTILRIFDSYGMECECFILLSGIFLSAKCEDGETISLIKRIKGHTINLYRIELVNSFSRQLQEHPVTYLQAVKVLEDIEYYKSYSFLNRLAAAGATAFVYTLLFKGSIFDGMAALLISLLIFTVKEKISKMGFFQFFEYFVSGMIIGAMTLIAVKVVPELSMYKIITGAVMILVPGVAMTNGIKDALYGDVVSSLYRLAEALFISLAVGAGVGMVLSFGLRFI